MLNGEGVRTVELNIVAYWQSEHNRGSSRVGCRTPERSHDQTGKVVFKADEM